jgi:uncharacterized protein
MKHFVAVFTFVAVFSVSFSQSYTVETVPNTRLLNGSHVSNPDNIISEQTVSQIDSVVIALENKSTAQVAIVLLNSIGEADIFEFSQDLFNRWGIGQASNSNGLLILLVKDKRTVRFHTGDGIEPILTDVLCKRIQREKMVPSFKDGNYDAGMLAGVVMAASVLNNPESFADSQQQYADEIPLYSITMWIIGMWMAIALIVFIVKMKRKSFANYPSETKVPKGQFTSGQWFFWFIILPLAVMIALTLADNAVFFFVGLYAYSGTIGMVRRNFMDRQAATLILEKDYHAVYNYYENKQGLFSFLRFIFPIPFAFMYGSYKKKMLFFRNHPRQCGQCGTSLTKLDENADNAFLEKGQVREEEVKSIDYDVWLCKNCQAHGIEIYPSKNSKFTACTKCSYKTFYVANNRTIKAATTSSQGLREETKLCKFCGHQEIRKYNIARVQSSSSSGGGGSSSSGSSWGGGSSGGGGASSSW